MKKLLFALIAITFLSLNAIAKAWGDRDIAKVYGLFCDIKSLRGAEVKRADVFTKDVMALLNKDPLNFSGTKLIELVEKRLLNLKDVSLNAELTKVQAAQERSLRALQLHLQAYAIDEETKSSLKRNILSALPQLPIEHENKDGSRRLLLDLEFIGLPKIVISKLTFKRTLKKTEDGKDYIDKVSKDQWLAIGIQTEPNGKNYFLACEVTPSGLQSFHKNEWMINGHPFNYELASRENYKELESAIVNSTEQRFIDLSLAEILKTDQGESSEFSLSSSLEKASEKFKEFNFKEIEFERDGVLLGMVGIISVPRIDNPKSVPAQYLVTQNREGEIKVFTTYAYERLYGGAPSIHLHALKSEQIDNIRN